MPAEYPRGHVGFTPVKIVHNGQLVSNSNPLPVTTVVGTAITQLTGDVLAGPGPGSVAATLNTILPQKGFLGISHTPSTVSTTGNLDNYTLLSGWMRFTGSGDLILTGINSTGIPNGTEIVFYNFAAGNFTLTFKSGSPSSLAANRFQMASDLVIGQYDCARFKYNATTSRWEIASGGNFKWSKEGDYDSTGIKYLGTRVIGATSEIKGIINGAEWATISTSEQYLTDIVYSSKSVEWGAHKLWFNGNLRYAWDANIIFDNFGQYSIDVGARTLINTFGNNTLDWENSVLKDSTNAPTVAWNAGYLINPYTGGVSYDWINNAIYDTINAPCVSFNSRGLYDSSGNLVFDWGSSPSIIQIADGVNLTFGISAGNRIGTSPSELLSFWGQSPTTQPSNSTYAASFTSNGGTPLTSTDTFDGYTIEYLVGALRISGIIT